MRSGLRYDCNYYSCSVGFGTTFVCFTRASWMSMWLAPFAPGCPAAWSMPHFTEKEHNMNLWSKDRIAFSWTAQIEKCTKFQTGPHHNHRINMMQIRHCTLLLYVGLISDLGSCTHCIHCPLSLRSRHGGDSIPTILCGLCAIE